MTELQHGTPDIWATGRIARTIIDSAFAESALAPEVPGMATSGLGRTELDLILGAALSNYQVRANNAPGMDTRRRLELARALDTIPSGDTRALATTLGANSSRLIHRLVQDIATNAREVLAGVLDYDWDPRSLSNTLDADTRRLLLAQQETGQTVPRQAMVRAMGITARTESLRFSEREPSLTLQDAIEGMAFLGDLTHDQTQALLDHVHGRDVTDADTLRAALKVVAQYFTEYLDSRHWGKATATFVRGSKLVMYLFGLGNLRPLTIKESFVNMRATGKTIDNLMRILTLITVRAFRHTLQTRTVNTDGYGEEHVIRVAHGYRKARQFMRQTRGATAYNEAI